MQVILVLFCKNLSLIIRILDRKAYTLVTIGPDNRFYLMNFETIILHYYYTNDEK